MDYYNILEVDKNASQAEIKKAIELYLLNIIPINKKIILMLNLKKLMKHINCYLILKKDNFMIYRIITTV